MKKKSSNKFCLDGIVNNKNKVIHLFQQIEAKWFRLQHTYILTYSSNFRVCAQRKNFSYGNPNLFFPCFPFSTTLFPPNIQALVCWILQYICLRCVPSTYRYVLRHLYKDFLPNKNSCICTNKLDKHAIFWKGEYTYIKCTFLSNKIVQKISFSLCFWASDHLIDKFN